MEKVLTLTKDQFENFNRSSNQVKAARKLLKIASNIKIGVGDTAAFINNSQPYEVYKNNVKGRDHYYIVIQPMGEEMAFTYSIYNI